MYFIQDGRIYFDGAVSLFKMTERYWRALAKLLPTIMKCSRWSLKASILKKTMQVKRIYDFTLDNAKHIFSIEPDYNLETFDSARKRVTIPAILNTYRQLCEFYPIPYHYSASKVFGSR
jgi:predicted nuclease of restriction endonuclease-like RecB superfamily